MRRKPFALALSLAGLIGAVIGPAVLAGPARQVPSTVQTITLFASATDKAGRPVEDLTADEFVLKENGRVQSITSAAIDRSPITLVLLVDRSASMTPQIARAEAMAQAIVDGLQDGDRARVGRIDDRAFVLSPDDFSADRAQLGRALRQFQTRPLNWTRLYDTVDGSITAMERIPGYRAVLVLSDGEDTASMRPRSDVAKHAQTSGVIVHAIEFAPPSRIANPPPQLVQLRSASPQLKPLAADVGGGYWRLPSGGDAQALVSQANAGLRSRYAITFVPSAVDGKMHGLELRTLRRDVVVRFAKKYGGKPTTNN